MGKDKSIQDIIDDFQKKKMNEFWSNKEDEAWDSV